MLRSLTTAALMTLALAIAPSAGADTLPAIQGITFVKAVKIPSRVGSPQNEQIDTRKVGKDATCGLRLSRDKETQREYNLQKGTLLPLIKDPKAEKAQTRPQGPMWMWRVEFGDKGPIVALGCTGMGSVSFAELQKAYADLMVLESGK